MNQEITPIIHICKECGFEIERNGHSQSCSKYEGFKDFENNLTTK